MDLDRINNRVDQALADNLRAERLLAGMALALFTVGVLVVLLAYWLKNPYVASGAALAQGLLVFPIGEIRRLRRDNVILQTFPVLIYGLPPDKAAMQIVELLKYLRGGTKR